MGSSLMANGPKNSVGQFHWIIARVKFPGLLPLPNDPQNKLEVALPFGRIDGIRGNLFGRGEYRGKNQSDKAVMISREGEDRGSYFYEPLFAPCLLRHAC